MVESYKRFNIKWIVCKSKSFKFWEKEVNKMCIWRFYRVRVENNKIENWINFNHSNFMGEYFNIMGWWG